MLLNNLGLGLGKILENEKIFLFTLYNVSHTKLQRYSESVNNNYEYQAGFFY